MCSGRAAQVCGKLEKLIAISVTAGIFTLRLYIRAANPERANFVRTYSPIKNFILPGFRIELPPSALPHQRDGKGPAIIAQPKLIPCWGFSDDSYLFIHSLDKSLALLGGFHDIPRNKVMHLRSEYSVQRVRISRLYCGFERINRRLR